MSARPDRTPLARPFFDRPVLTVAPDLLGRILVRRTPEGPMELRITEVEAYEGEADPGSHAYRGRTQRNASMFGPPGHAYVYFIYGMWFSLNLVCGPPGHASGVLLRAGEITVGADLARKRRLSARSDGELAKGPARLATALAVDRSLDGTDLCAGPDSPLALLTGTATPSDLVGNGPRTGVGGAGADHPYRYWITHDPTVSPYRAHAPRRRST
ncbi:MULTISPECIES: DNA-3-methyladenine glycosylase [unclassified Streptomyces]|uniref:DNA-3-methyladenine glycosylase n=1 Tax=unclassified Streptomyces TaxID=2593676 RepID=UPI00332CB06B